MHLNAKYLSLTRQFAGMQSCTITALELHVIWLALVMPVKFAAAPAQSTYIIAGLHHTQWVRHQQ